MIKIVTYHESKPNQSYVRTLPNSTLTLPPRVMSRVQVHLVHAVMMVRKK